MKKMTMLFGFVFLMSGSVTAQNKFALLIKRIALLQVYLEYLQKGYSIARHGWETVHSITKGEFDLHADYFRSLEKINPAVKRLGALAAVISSESRMIKAAAALRKYVNSADHLEPEEVRYIYSVLDGLLSHIEKDMELFNLVTKDGKLKMGDASRVEWILKIASQVRERERFVAMVTASVQGLENGRADAFRDVLHMRDIASPLNAAP
jgi:hypothetical protein